MANYFLDFEFIEGFHKPFFGKRRHFIDMISVGITCDDGREYSAISNEFDVKQAWNKYQEESTGKLDLPGVNRSIEKKYWLRYNVLHPIWKELQYLQYRTNDNDVAKEYFEILDSMPESERVDFYINKMLLPNSDFFELKNLSDIIKKFGKSNKQIAKEIIEFVNPDWLGHPVDKVALVSENTAGFLKLHNAKAFDLEGVFDCYFAQPTFYGYYSAYDHVLLCSLFGTMMQLPSGFPMYTRDLKQMVDDWVTKALPHLSEVSGESLTFEQGLKILKDQWAYPKQTNEHTAISDARWNHELYKFITS